MIIAEDHPFVGAEGTVVGTVPVNGLLIEVDGIDVRVPRDAVEYLNEEPAALSAITGGTRQPKNASGTAKVLLMCAGGILALTAISLLPDANREYDYGYVMGVARYISETGKNLDCVRSSLLGPSKSVSGYEQHFKVCYKDLQSDDAMNDAADIFEQDLGISRSMWRRIGFKRGWKKPGRQILPRTGLEFLEDAR